MIPTQTYFYHAAEIVGDERVILFHKGEVLLCQDSFLWPGSVLSQLHEAWYPLLLVGDFAAQRVLALNLPPDWSQDDFKVSRATPRQLLQQHNFADFAALGRANQLINWYETHHYCGSCGAPTRTHDNDRALVCTACQRAYYPRINPCVIVLVTRGEEFLLARHARGNASYSSCLAGFMEVGETPEDTVKREVMEEVGIEVNNIRYVKSQSWPFPSQLMLGFFADYKSGAIQVDGYEIAQADWYTRESAPAVPSADISVAGQLIELFLQGLPIGKNHA